MFKSGDKIVCIDTTSLEGILKIGKTYTFDEYSESGNIRIEEIIVIPFLSHRFISLKLYRKQKLKKLKYGNYTSI
jgi:hypothetical protein